MATVSVLPFVVRPFCPKCGNDHPSLRYDAALDALVFDCRACTYRWATEPKDAPQEDGPRRSVDLTGHDDDDEVEDANDVDADAD